MKETIDNIVFEVTHTERTEPKKVWNDITSSVQEQSVIICDFVGTIDGKEISKQSVEIWKQEDIDNKTCDIMGGLKFNAGVLSHAEICAKYANTASLLNERFSQLINLAKENAKAREAIESEPD